MEFFILPNIKTFKKIFSSIKLRRKKCIYSVKHESLAKTSWACNKRYDVFALPPFLNKFCFINIERIILTKI